MNKQIQNSLLKIAGGFLFIQVIILTLSPAVRQRAWVADISWTHWIVLIVWGGFIIYAYRVFNNQIPDADPYLFPAAALLSGWGILTIWRLEPDFGGRQLLWFSVSMIGFLAGMRLPSLKFLQRYKYILLFVGLSLTTLTLLFGTNPSGFGPRLWLGCCGVYFQPSEPLKLLLIIYLSAYFSEKFPYRIRTINILYPTLVLGGIVVLLLLVQRDLGTASIFLALYTGTTYLAANRKRILLISGLSIIAVGIIGYRLVSVINTRINTWINPWIDPGGNSYQIVQALIAIANGGIEGRGLGLGNPDLVPVAISDFIFSAMAEETGLIGTLGLLAIYGLILTRGFRAALRAPDLFRRLLAAGISTYIGIQAILIIGGNLRLLPLTGVTLPFVSYGGSSLLTSFVALLLLILVSNHHDEEPALLENPLPYRLLHAILFLGLFTSALANGWWSVIRGPYLVQRNDNLRYIIEGKYVPRGEIVDRKNTVITATTGDIGTYARLYSYPNLSPITGYSSITYGQAGLESSLDGYLRGLDGNSAIAIWREHLLYGMSPPGLDIRLSLDLDLQSQADTLMHGQNGAIILLNVQSGEILVMASHPTYDPNDLNEIAADLLTDPDKPLINRAASGLYPTGTLLEPFATILYGDLTLGRNDVAGIFNIFGFDRPPYLRMETAPSFINEENGQLYSSPLQMALASAALSNKGIIPAPRIAVALNTPKNGWIVLPALDTAVEAIQPSTGQEEINSFIESGDNFWSRATQALDDESHVTWFLAGTPPVWQSTPLVVVVVLEKLDLRLAKRIGRNLLIAAMNP